MKIFLYIHLLLKSLLDYLFIYFLFFWILWIFVYGDLSLSLKSPVYDISVIATMEVLRNRIIASRSEI